MLVELAAANAAFAVIKETVQNSGEIMNAAKAMSQLFDSEAALRKRLLEKSGSTVNTDAEEFFALEQIKNQKAELERAMTYHGRPGLIDDWRMFQAKAAKQREQARIEELQETLRKRRALVEAFWWTMLALLTAALIYFAAVIYQLFTERNS